MRLGKFVKSPDERKRYVIDYREWLDTGETVSGVTFAVTPTGELDVDAYSINGSANMVSFFVDDGDDGETYRVVVTATTSGGQVKQDYVLFSVRAPTGS